MSCFNEGWYVMYTRPRHERRVATDLSDQKIQGYCPSVKVIRTFAEKKKFVDALLFPCYVFVYLQSMEQYYTGLHIDGVCYFLRNGKTVARLKNDVVDNIRLSVGGGGDLEITEELFPPGRQLIITTGPFTGLSCEAVKNKGRDRYLVRVELLQRSLLITMPASALMTNRAAGSQKSV